MNLTSTNLSKLLLLPQHYCIEEHMDQVEELLMNHPVFSHLCKLEQSIQPVLTSIEENGVVVANEWFTTGLQEKRNQLAHVSNELNQLIGSSSNDVVEERALRKFWSDNDFPQANGFDALRKYKHLHPTFRLMMERKSHQNYLKMWDEKLKQKGAPIMGGISIKGTWQSFASYTGRITARNLPLTSMPIAMRDYIVSQIGQQIVSLDLDNAELRFLAHYAKCDSLAEQFNQGIDVHAETAKLLRGSMAGHGVNDEQARKLAKQFTYSLLYGAGAQTIVKNMQKVSHSITNADVVALIDEFYELYPELQVFLKERASSPKLLTPLGEIEPVAKFTRTQKKNYALQAGVSVAIQLLMTTLAEHGIKIIHVLHDEAWVLLDKGMNLDNLIKQVEGAFKKKMKKHFPGLPTKQILAKAKIGGN